MSATQGTEEPDGLTVTEAARAIGCHPQTLRKALREADPESSPVGVKVQGRYGPEWRIPADNIESLKEQLGPESANGESALTQAQASIIALMGDLKAELMGGLRALGPSPEEVAARAERERRIEEALAGNAETIRELGEALGQAEAESDHQRARADAAEAEADELREELRQERARSWWAKLTGRNNPRPTEL